MSAETVSAAEATPARPLWKKILQFPLVSMVIAIAAIALGAVVFVGPVVFLDRSGIVDVTPEVGPILSNVLLAIGAIVAYKLLVTRVGRIRRDELRFSGAMRPFLGGVSLGTGVMLASFIVVYLAGGYRLLGLGGARDTAMLLLVAGFYAAFFEEILFRGILQRWLEEFGGTWFALVAISALFGFVHITNDNATAFSSVSIAIAAGLLLGGAYVLTRSLWLPIGLHFGWNVTQGWVLDVPVSGNDFDGLLETEPAGPEWLSGGAFGLEASVVALLFGLVVGVWLLVKAYRAGNFVGPMWSRSRRAGSDEAVRVDVDSHAHAGSEV